MQATSTDTHAAATVGTKKIAVWPLTGGDAKAELIEVVGATSNERVKAFALGAHGELVVAAVEGGPKPRLLLVPKKGAARELAAGSNVVDVRIAPDGSEAIAVSGAELIALDLPAGTVRWKKPSSNIGRGGNWALGLAWQHALFTQSGAQLVVAKEGGALLTLDAKSGREQGELGAELRRVKTALFTGPTEVAAASDEHIVFWSTAEGRVTRTETIHGGAKMRLVAGDIVIENADDTPTGCAPDEQKLTFERWSGTKRPPALADDAPVTKTTVWPPPRGESEVCAPKSLSSLLIEKGIALSAGVADVAGTKQQGMYVVDLKTKKRT